MGTGSRIREIRRNAGLSQVKFSESLGITQGYLSEVESEKKEPSKTLLLLISKLYGPAIEWVERGEGTMDGMETAPPPAPHPADDPRARRWEALRDVVEGIDDEAKRSAVLDELFARAQDAAEIAALRKEVERLSEARRKAG